MKIIDSKSVLELMKQVNSILFFFIKTIYINVHMYLQCKQNSRNENEYKYQLENYFISKAGYRSVLTSYNKQTYFYVEMDFSKNINSIMDKKSGMTYKEYYKQKKYLDINVDDLDEMYGLIKCRNTSSKYKEYCYLIPQLCLLTGLPLFIENKYRNELQKVYLTVQQFLFVFNFLIL